ncbi:MAG: methyltransferase domain-containing protein [Anaerolineales bacterium]|nr:methyltransferase domain-containing protein [Anaerolineales bacterium]
MNSHFDLIARFYDRVIPFVRLEQVLRVLDLPRAASLLDAGGGTGRVAEALRPHLDWVVVADVSREMLAQAHQRDLVVTSTATEHLPFPDGTFDRVLMVDALHHVADQAQTIRELYRVLKVGGRLVIDEPDVRTFSVKLLALAEKLALMRSHFLAPPQIARLFPSEARVRIETEEYTAWVIAEK